MIVRRPSVLPVLLLLAACAAPAPVQPAPELGVDPAEMRRTSSGLYIRTDREGEGLAAREGTTVVVHYTAWLADGTRIESSREMGEPLVVTLGPDSRLVPGWDEGIRGMRPGGKRTLLIPPRLGYGRSGGGEIPPNAWLVFEIELLELR